MRKALAVIACVMALTVPAGDVWAAQKKKVVTVSRSVTSPVVEVDRWGELQLSVRLNLTTTTVGTKKTKSFKVTAVSWPVYPSQTDRSAFISGQALPLLRQEVLQLKDNSIQLVSGATDTSYAFAQALRGALGKAGAL
jgi:uncharacterized protein with FMN-binding domain